MSIVIHTLDEVEETKKNLIWQDIQVCEHYISWFHYWPIVTNGIHIVGAMPREAKIEVTMLEFVDLMSPSSCYEMWRLVAPDPLSRWLQTVYKMETQFEEKLNQSW